MYRTVQRAPAVPQVITNTANYTSSYQFNLPYFPIPCQIAEGFSWVWMYYVECRV